MISEGQNISSETILPRIPELFVDEKLGNYLVLNPLGPWWFVGSKIHADFVRLCDGKRSLRDIFESLSPQYKGVTDENLIQITKSLLDENFFTATEKSQIRPLSIVFFNITKRCNLSCPYCYYDSASSQSKEHENELDSDVWIKLSNDIAKINPRAKIIVSGGEPLIRPDAIDIIEGISRNNLEIKLITNATLFTSDIISRLSKIDKFSIQVSIDSIIPEENAKTRGPGNLEKALKAVQDIRDAAIDVEISATITQINLKSIRQFRQFCNKNSIKFRSSIFMLSGERSKRNAQWLELSSDDYLDASTYCLENFDNKTTMGHPMVPGERRYGCGAGYGQIDISPDGSVLPCSHLNDPALYFGNIQTSNIEQLAEVGYKRYSYIDVDGMDPCSSSKCPMRYFCGGGCRANSLHNYGTTHHIPKNCSELKQIYLKGLWVSVLGSSFLAETDR
ncbi:MAG: pyrroloquinoline quinone biosynthesis protein PqqE [Methanosaeta sp. PtaU1.Bin112]|nr:MAG: pyrroloquinoline quinone biosynthesis protein PqqE [Methanosaeta sp. PtaU1.Bin112]